MEFLRDELVRLLDNYEAQSTHYINKDQILLDILKSIDDNKLCEKNVCIACGIDLGISNPRMTDFKDANRILHERGVEPRRSNGKKVYDLSYTKVQDEPLGFGNAYGD